MMSNLYNNIKNFLSGTDSSTPNNSDNSPNSQTGSSKTSPMSQGHENRAGEAPAYKATFNYAIPSTQYAKVGKHQASPSSQPRTMATGFPPCSSGSHVPAPQFTFNGVVTPTHHMQNIPPPQQSLFSAPTMRNHRYEANSGPKSDMFHFSGGVDQSSPTPSSTPLDKGNNGAPYEEPTDVHSRRATIEEDEQNEAKEHAHTSAPNELPFRACLLQPDNRGIPIPPKRKDWVDEIVYEEDAPEKSLPEGYLGTFRGSRHFIPDYDGMRKCGLNDMHHLTCGHYILSSKHCGSNCKTEELDLQPFNCKACRDILSDAIRKKITGAERNKLRKLKETDKISLIACATDCVTRCVPELKANIGETVNAMYRQYGRTCERADAPPPLEFKSMEENVREMQAEHERRKLGGMEEKDSTTENAKRKDREDGDKVSSNAQDPAAYNAPDADTDMSDDDTQNLQTISANKKQKTKLENHREPITAENRGTKRPSTPEPSSSSASSSSSSSPSPTNKKQKRNFVSSPSPFTLVPGAKHAYVPTFTALFNLDPPKRVCMTAPSKFAETSFMAPPADVLRPMMRERDSAVHVEGPIEAEENKRRRAAWMKENGEKSAEEERLQPLSMKKERKDLFKLVFGEDDEL